VEDLDLIVETKPRTIGASSAIVGSLVLHALLIIWLAYNYHPVTAEDRPTPILRYVELMRQNNPRQFTEAPGPKVDRAPLNAPFSDANRRASSPRPTGDTPTTRPGESNRLYTPPIPTGDNRPAQAPSPAIQQSPSQPAQDSQASAAPDPAPAQTAGQSALIYRQQPETQKASAGAVDWRTAIRDAGKMASLGSGQATSDLGNPGGGEKGFTAEEGPISFETQWYDWGEYAQSMVSRIRLNWYNNMPPIGLGAVSELVPAAGRRASAASRAGVRDEPYAAGAPTDRIEI